MGFAVLAGAPSWSVHAQVAGRVYRVGVLSMGAPSPSVENAPILFEVELARHGFVKGANLSIEIRFASSDASRLDALALELVALKPDVIMSAAGTRGALAAKKATTTIPIVFGLSNDPVGSKLVDSLARPGRNVTGNVMLGAQLDLKRLQILAETLGRRATLAVLDVGFSEERRNDYRRLAAETSSTPLAGLLFVEVRSGDELVPAFEHMARQRVDGVAINASPLTAANVDRIAGLVVQHRLAAIADGAQYAKAGVLLAYSADSDEISRNAARYVATILKGANPAELPVEHISKFNLIVNMKAARSLDIRISRYLLARANAIIE